LLSFTPKHVAWLGIYRLINDALLKSPSRAAKNLNQVVGWLVEETKSRFLKKNRLNGGFFVPRNDPLRVRNIQ
jgi:hypothetical protein